MTINKQTKLADQHHFHIPVMGTAFTIDTPIKVARFGISSVVSLCDDELCEEMRKHYSEIYKFDYTPIEKNEEDFRARRMTAYLNLLDTIVNQQIETMKNESFEPNTDLTQYFEMLPDTSSVKLLYKTMLKTSLAADKLKLQSELKDQVKPGSIDVNIMTKLDRTIYDKEGNELKGFSDALAGLRGYANSTLHSSIVFSAGFNRRLYAFISEFKDFFPDETGYIKKKVILKVSDFRSSLTQGKFLAKKGVWISEYRIESGLNCGGHAFASDGYLLGPILEEFKQKKTELLSSLLATCNESLKALNAPVFSSAPESKITVQGGIGTAKENEFLLNYYNVDCTGWATPFLLVPEVTIVDDATRMMLSRATSKDLYLSEISPLGVPFNSVKGTESEKQKLERFENGRPGSPCPKGFLVSSTEFSKKPVCTASVFFQKRKIEYLKTLGLPPEALQDEIRRVVDKACLCEDLAASSLIQKNIENKRPLKTAVCPGPNLAYFSRLSSLKEMVSHIYGRLNLLNSTYRSNMFINELSMYLKYYKKEVENALKNPTEKQKKYLTLFQNNLFEGMDYYKSLIPKLVHESKTYQDTMMQELTNMMIDLEQFIQKNHSVCGSRLELQTA